MTTDGVYRDIVLRLVFAIAQSLEQMEEKNYAAAEEILRKAGREAAGENPPGLVLR